MSSYFLVRQARGPEWDPSKGRREQAGWDLHVAFVDRLGDRAVIGGPIGDVDGEFVVLVVRAEERPRRARCSTPTRGWDRSCGSTPSSAGPCGSAPTRSKPPREC
jgi:hypothetical protein